VPKKLKNIARVVTITVRDADLDAGKVEIKMEFDTPAKPGEATTPAVHLALGMLESVKHSDGLKSMSVNTDKGRVEVPFGEEG
jgi:hypothetical protein